MSSSTNAGSSSSRSSNTGLHARTGSIKRTPSDLSRDLASVDLPPPSAITAAESQSKNSQRRNTVEKELDELDLDEPEGQLVWWDELASWEAGYGEKGGHESTLDSHHRKASEQ